MRPAGRKAAILTTGTAEANAGGPAAQPGLSRGAGAAQGYALVAVLWAVGLLALIAALIVRASHVDVSRTSNAVETLRAAYIADAAVHAVMADLLAGRAVPGGAVTPAVMVTDAGTATAADIVVTVHGTVRKIDLNRADGALLTALFQAAGAGNARRLAAAILDWRDGDDTPRPLGAERDFYETAGRAGPANRPFSHVRELAYVAGMDDTLLTRVADAVTVWGGPRITPRGAPPLVLAALAALDEGARTRLVSESVPPSARLEILADVRLQNGPRFRRRAVVRLLPGLARPYQIAVWERLPGGENLTERAGG